MRNWASQAHSKHAWSVHAEIRFPLLSWVAVILEVPSAVGTFALRFLLGSLVVCLWPVPLHIADSPYALQHEDPACDCMQVRGTLLTASQCATYDDTKRLWMRTTGWRDGLGTHVGVSMITGVPSATCASSLGFGLQHTAASHSIICFQANIYIPAVFSCSVRGSRAGCQSRGLIKIYIQT